MEIRIRVVSIDERGIEKELYRNYIPYDPNIQFPYEQVYNTLSLLYRGKSTYIQFSIF